MIIALSPTLVISEGGPGALTVKNSPKLMRTVIKISSGITVKVLFDIYLGI